MPHRETLEEKYAQALLEVAREVQAERRIAEDLAFVGEILRAIPELLLFLAHPRVAPEGKEAVLAELKEKIHPYTLNLLRLLVRHGRAGLLPKLSSAYYAALEKMGGPVYVLVRTAQPLSPELQERLRARLEEALGREVALEEELRPELLAGVELVISGRRLDASLRGRLERLRRALGG